ncbi:MAG TPA: DUF427 domain-containing protein [Marmoricola sp.]|jgi:uncharacterized protein (DUF427 family)|nr:DUF427 domain-containing protein [Marmoricola sp.]
MRKPRLEPGRLHPITVEPAEGRVTVRYGDRQIAATDRALVLREASYPPVYYVPLDEVDPAVLEPSTHTSYCPYKGDASYYSLHDGDRRAADAVWTYRTPYDAVAGIAGHVAFYPEHVEIANS